MDRPDTGGGQGALRPTGASPKCPVGRMSALIGDVLLGGLLVARHRSFALGLVLGGALLAIAATAGDSGVIRRALFVAAGSLGVLAGTRLSAPPAALFASRRTAAPRWMPPIGRLLGGVAVTAPITLVGLLLLVRSGMRPSSACEATLLAVLFLCSWTALVAGSAPLTGEAVAGVVSGTLVWLGGIAPSAVQHLLTGAPMLQRPAVLAWNLLPLGWRVERAAAAGSADSLVLGGWVVAGLLILAWSVDWVFLRDATGTHRR